ncbi:MAG: PqqD family protein [Methyloligellaceae bacterium]
MKSKFVLSSTDVVFEEFDGEYVVLNLASGKYHAIDKSAALIWKFLMDGVAPAHILAKQDIGGDVVSLFIERLVELELITADAAENGRDLRQSEAEELLQMDSKPTIEVFDELSDLILADPIHDVEETQGWPVKPAVN